MNRQTRSSLPREPRRRMPRETGALIIAALMAVLQTLTPAARGAPVFGDIMSVRQPDGTMIKVRVWGDEFYGVTESLDGYTLVRDPKTLFHCFARPGADAKDLVSTGVRVGAGPAGVPGLVRHLRVRPASSAARARAARARHTNDLLAVSQKTGAVTASVTTGSVVGITLLVEFPEEAYTISRQAVENYCNQVGYTGYGNNGSVRDYYYDVSDHQLTYTNYVAVYYQAQHNKSYYTDPAVPSPERARELTVEALNALEAGGFDFSQYDADHNGAVDAVNVYYVGTHGNDWGEGLWPHSAGLAWSADGVWVIGYQITDMKNALTLGTFCHENGHMLLGWPDLYDYDYDSAGVGEFCLMFDGVLDTNPIEPCAYLKYIAGWCSVTELSGAPAQPGLVVPSDRNMIYKYSHPTLANEYYLIENRQKTGRDLAIADAGLAIWHIDTTGSNDNQQMTPESHYKVTLMQADGDWDLEHNRNLGDGTDLHRAPFFTRCAPDSAAPTNWWSGDPTSLYVTRISASASVMTFDYNYVDPDIWVDFDYVGAETGSYMFPYNTLAEGISAVPAGGYLFVWAGTTSVTPTITKAMTIDNWGGDVIIGE